MGWWTQGTQVEPEAPKDNRARFLDFISQAEGGNYNTLVGGGTFDSYTQHPNVIGLRTAEGPSKAAGRYQITKKTYDDVAPRLGITDFSPQSQDAIALALIKRKNALEDIDKGDFTSAINKLGSTWASLPTSPYKQRKLSWDQTNKMLGMNVTAKTTSDNWWAGATPVTEEVSGDNWWAGSTPVVEAVGTVGQRSPTPAAPSAAPQAAPTAPAAAAKAPEPRSIPRRIDDFVRGVADTVTFGYADEFAAKMDQLTGLNTATSNKPLVRPDAKLSDLITGQNPRSYPGILQEQRQRDTEGGGERVAGQLTGALAPTVGVIRTVPTASRILKAGAGALTGAIQGGLYGTGSSEATTIDGRLKDAVVPAGIGAATGGVLGAVIPASVKQKVSTEIRKAGSVDDAALKAEVAQALKREFENPARMVDKKLSPLTPQEMNQRVTKGFIDEAKEAVKQLPKDFKGKSELLDGLNKGINISQPAIEALKKTPEGKLVADVIFRAQKSDAMTKQMLQSPTFMGHAIRMGIDAAPPAVGAMMGGPVGGAIGLGLTKFIADPIAKKITGKMTRTEVGQKVIDKVSKLSPDILAKTGPSKAASSTEALKKLVAEAQATKQAQIDANVLKKAAAPRVSKATEPQIAISDLQAKDPTYLLGLGNRLGSPRNADEMSEFSGVIKNQMEARIKKQAESAEKARQAAQAAKGAPVDTKIQVLQDTRRPLSGAFQELLPNGRSGLNLNSKEAVDALRLVSRQLKDRPVGQAAKDILRSGNVPDENAFYGVQNQVRKLQEGGMLGNRSGALSDATGSVQSVVRNPQSYQAAIDTADAARKLAVDSAPNKSLAQFANTVAAKTSPAEKAKLIEERLAKTNDPAIRDYLETLVKPLAEFGKKPKK